MGEDKKELLIRRSLKRVRLCTQHSNSFSPKRMQWPMTYTSNCLFKSLQPEVWWADPNPKQTPQILPVSGQGRTWTKGPGIWPLPPPWLQPSWLKDHVASFISVWLLLYPRRITACSHQVLRNFKTSVRPSHPLARRPPGFSPLEVKPKFP